MDVSVVEGVGEAVAVGVGLGEAVGVGEGEDEREAVGYGVGVIGCMYRIYLLPAYTHILKVGLDKCLVNIQ